MGNSELTGTEVGNRCWAAPLGNCSAKMSHEHTVSRGLFPTDEIFVQGFSWCEKEPKKIGINSFTRKILCEKHNNELSAADNAAIDTANKFRGAFDLLKARERLKPRIWNREEFHIDVYGLERWFLKTLINLAFEGDRTLGGDATVPGRPSRRLIEIAFGRKRFKDRAGLYVITHDGQEIPSEDRVRIITCSARAEPTCLIGARFYLHGFPYLLCLDKTGAPEGLAFIGRDGTAYTPTAVFYRRAHLKFDIGGRLSHIIHIEDTGNP